jgi:4-amino-4-deoxy-L-arabinose transferase-like glycosyltransferase
VRALLLLLAATLLLRLPFLDHPIQGDDTFYLAVAQNAQINPAHPHDFTLRAAGLDVDMRGFVHPPGNGWILGAILAIAGDVREPLFHAVYWLFSFGAVAFAWMIASRHTGRPWLAVILFIATPAFVINGNSLESDMPFLFFWLGAVAAWVEAVERDSVWFALGSVPFMAGAALVSYQAIVLTAVLAAFGWRRPRRWWQVFVLAPAAAFAGWQLFEWATTGTMPIQLARQYLAQYGYQAPEKRWLNALGLTVHLGWMVSPVLIWFAFPRWWPIAALSALAGAAAIDVSPLFWLPFGTGVLAFAAATADRGHARIRFWLGLFFVSALLIFFAGSARYILPAALPLAILIANALENRPRLVAVAAGCHIALGLSLASANFQFWNGYRELIARHPDIAPKFRLWTNAEWGLRFYAETAGALPVKHGQTLGAGDRMLVSGIGDDIPVSTGGGARVQMWEQAIRPASPLRLIGMGVKSGYSTNQLGLRAFDLATGPADVVRLDVIVARDPVLSYLPMNAPEAEFQIVSGVYQLEEGNRRWASGRALFQLRAPNRPSPFEATFYLTPHAAGRTLSLIVDGKTVASKKYDESGLYTLRSEEPAAAKPGPVSAAVVMDGSFRIPGDNRELGFVLTGLGFTPAAK